MAGEVLEKPAPLKVLVVDDNPADLELIRRELCRAITAVQVETAMDRGSFVDGLGSGPAVVLSDFEMPGFDVREVLALVAQHCPDVPVIVVSGAIGEEQAVGTIKDGAFDYLLKDRLSRLGVAIEKAAEWREIAKREREAVSARRRLVAMVESTPDIVALLGDSGGLRYVNHAGRVFLGIGSDDPLAEVEPARIVPPALTTVTAERRKNRPSGESVWQGEYRVRDVEGREIPFLCSLIAHAPPNGGELFYSYVARDLTELKRAQAEVNLIFDLAPDPICATNPGGVVTRLNPAVLETLGYSEEELRGRSLFEFVLPEDREAFEAAFDNLSRGAGSETITARVRGKRGSIRWLEWHSVGVPAEHTIFSVVRDVTERRLAEHRLGILVRVADRLNATLDTGELLALLVRESTELVGAASGIAGLREGDRLIAIAAVPAGVVPSAKREWRRGEGLPGLAFECGRMVDSTESGGRGAGDTETGGESLCVPILDATRQVIGFLQLTKAAGSGFTAFEKELSNAIAKTASIALGNAFAFRSAKDAEARAERHAERLRAIVELKREIESLDGSLEETLTVIIRRLAEVTGAAGASLEKVRDDETEVWLAEGAAAGLVGRKFARPGSHSGRCIESRSLEVCRAAGESTLDDARACHLIGLETVVSMAVTAGGALAAVIKIHGLAANAFSDNDGRLVEVCAGIAGGMIVRRAAQDALQRSAREYRDLFEGNPQPILVFDVSSLAIKAVNAAAIAQYGFSREEFLALTLADIRPEEDVPLLMERLESVGPSGSDFGTYRHRRKDGSIMLVEITSHSIDFRGKPSRLVVINDVTEQRDSEKKIVEQARLIDLATDAIIVRGLDHQIRFWNAGAERIYGWTRDEVLGKSVETLFYVNPASFREGTGEVLASGAWHGELKQLTKSGAVIDADCRWTLLRGDDGNPAGILSINSDVTEKKKIEHQYLRAQRMESIGTLAGGVSHDLNNVLAPILMSIGLLRQRVTDPTAVRVLDTIEASTKRGSNMVKQILSFARGVEGERLLLHPRHIVREIVTIMEETFPKEIFVESDVPEKVWPIVGDPTQLHQVLLNLCVNARDAMPAGGIIRVEGFNREIDRQFSELSGRIAPGDYVAIKITDTGVGMPPEVRERIFEPFYTTKEVGKGTGLGLSTVIGIVKGHQGTIQVESEVNRGTSFTIYLPATRNPEERVQENGRKSDSIPRGHGESVLIIDDEASVRTIMRQTLEAFGYGVLEATNGAEGVAVFAQNRHRIKVVITDLMMPVMDGAATISALKQIDAEMPIVAISGVGGSENVNKVARLGVEHFLTKPFDARTLLETIHQIIPDSADPYGLNPT